MCVCAGIRFSRSWTPSGRRVCRRGATPHRARYHTCLSVCLCVEGWECACHLSSVISLQLVSRFFAWLASCERRRNWRDIELIQARHTHRHTHTRTGLHVSLCVCVVIAWWAAVGRWRRGRVCARVGDQPEKRPLSAAGEQTQRRHHNVRHTKSHERNTDSAADILCPCWCGSFHSLG